MTWLPVRLLACTLSLGAAALAAAPFTADDLVRLKRISDPQVSPNGSVLAFVQRETDLEANKGRTSLWLLDLLDPAGEPQRASGGAFSDSSPRWSSDGHTLYFLSSRSGSTQVWRLNLPALAPQ
jgi:Tol biopolymer transport system component